MDNSDNQRDMIPRCMGNDLRNRLLAAAGAQTACDQHLAELHERRRRFVLVQRLANDLGRRLAPDRARLDCYQVQHGPKQQAVLDRVTALAEVLPAFVADGQGAIWYGTVGTGKDHMAAALLYQAVQQHGLCCRWLSGLDLYADLRDNIRRDQSERDRLTQLCQPDVLCLSDPCPPAGGDLTAWRMEFLKRLIDWRWRHGRSTWVTLNAASEADADTRLSAEVFDRLRDGAQIFACFWPSYRRSQ